jgi:hypothetical protein
MFQICCIFRLSIPPRIWQPIHDMRVRAVPVAFDSLIYLAVLQFFGSPFSALAPLRPSASRSGSALRSACKGPVESILSGRWFQRVCVRLCLGLVAAVMIG